VFEVGERGDAEASNVASQDLKRKTARGAVVSTGAQATTFVVRTGSLVVLARLLLKEDFGLVNMVTAVTGFLGLLRYGLSMATVQRLSITEGQSSTLFWINLAVGGALALMATITAPILVAFYAEPRLFWVTVALGTILVFNGAAEQHRALLQRSMRFVALAVIDIASLVVSVTAGIGMAVAGHGYWALVAMTISQPVVSAVGVWLATGWIPGLPRRRSGIRSMVAYGGAVTLNNLLAYLAFNVDKVLIGRVWGADALGVYGRAYQLVNLSNDTLHSTIGSVAFPALSRVQDDPERLKAYFLKGYCVFLSLVLPITVACALFANDIIVLFLGPKWSDAAAILRLLAPTVLAFAFTNPFGWLMLGTGRAGRCVRIAAIVTPVLILGYALGLKHGPQGVAVGFSIAMVGSILPVMLWAKQGTLISLRDIFRAVVPSAVSLVAGVGAVMVVRPMLDHVEQMLARLTTESAVLFGVYLLTLLFIMKQKSLYVGLLREVGLWPLGSWRTAVEKA
jgi:PST family polysaccharide transporter